MLEPELIRRLLTLEQVAGGRGWTWAQRVQDISSKTSHQSIGEHMLIDLPEFAAEKLVWAHRTNAKDKGPRTVQRRTGKRYRR